MADDITVQRLDQRIEWYDRHAAYNQRAYKVLKLIVIVTAALIPFLSGTDGFKPPWLVGALGVVIAVAEGIHQLNQHHVNWTSYRSTCEALKHEKYLYLAKAAPYAGATDAHALLAERVESLMSQETAKWATLQERSDKKPGDSSSANKDG
jgi:hypothetical protein